MANREGRKEENEQGFITKFWDPKFRSLHANMSYDYMQ